MTQRAYYAFPAMRGEATRGLPANHAAPPRKGNYVRTYELPPLLLHRNDTVCGAGARERAVAPDVN